MIKPTEPERGEPLRLLIVTRENEQDQAYGLGKTLTPVVAQLRKKGHHVVYFSKVACPEIHAFWQPRFERFLRWLTPELSMGIAERLVQGIAAATRAIQDGITHIWVHDPWLVLGVALGMMRKKKRLKKHCRLIVSEHGLGSFIWSACQDGVSISVKQYRRMLWLERRILRYADAVFSPSQVAMDALVRDLGLLHQPAHFHVMGYGRPELTPSQDRQPQTQKEAQRLMGMGHISEMPDTLRPIVLLAVGRLSPVKQFSRLIDIAALLETQYNLPVQLLIAGQGDALSLQQQAQEQRLKYPPMIGFIEDVAIPFAAADFYIGTCPVESYGQANREALAAGCVALAPTGGGSGEVLGQGALLQPLQADSIAERIAFLWRTPEHYQYWQQQALQEAKRWPDWNQIADQYENVFYTLRP